MVASHDHLMGCTGFVTRERTSVSASDLSEVLTISPTVGRRWLAQEVRRLREAAGLKQSEVAKRLRCNPSKIGHMESMRNTISGPDLEVMLSFLGVPPERIDWYLQLADVAMKGAGGTVTARSPTGSPSTSDSNGEPAKSTSGIWDTCQVCFRQGHTRQR
ncbi:helix-turn-helix domain-containing protein [Saccharopolyspora sp. NPDC000995]